MQTDIFGTPVSLASKDTSAHWDQMQMAFLAHSAITPTHLAKVLEAEPHFALGHAVKGLFYLMLGRRELLQIAVDAHADAQSALKTHPATQREQKFVAALGLWLDHCIVAARNCVEEILCVYPHDALAMKISHAISFILGDSAAMRHSLEAVQPAYAPSHPAYGYLQGCYAFALEETGEYARAESYSLKGLSYAPDDAWGLHAVAHVYDMTANAQKGLEFLSGHENAWAHCNNFRYHVWWHKALMHLDLGETDRALDLYDSQIRADKTDDYRDISNATSLLSRLELNGTNVGSRWDELADLCENRTEDGCLIFADLHYLLALIGGNRDTAIHSMLKRMNQDAHKSTDFGKTAANPGAAAAAGLDAFGDANYALAFQNLAAARPTMQTIGGSHAQRDVFERLTIDAGIRAGFLNEAKHLLDERKTKRGGTEDGYAAARYDMIAKSNANSVAPQPVAAE